MAQSGKGASERPISGSSSTSLNETTTASSLPSLPSLLHTFHHGSEWRSLVLNAQTIDVGGLAQLSVSLHSSLLQARARHRTAIAALDQLKTIRRAAGPSDDNVPDPELESACAIVTTFEKSVQDTCGSMFIEELLTPEYCQSDEMRVRALQQNFERAVDTEVKSKIDDSGDVFLPLEPLMSAIPLSAPLVWPISPPPAPSPPPEEVATLTSASTSPPPPKRRRTEFDHLMQDALVFTRSGSKSKISDVFEASVQQIVQQMDAKVQPLSPTLSGRSRPLNQQQLAQLRTKTISTFFQYLDSYFELPTEQNLRCLVNDPCIVSYLPEFELPTAVESPQPQQLDACLTHLWHDFALRCQLSTLNTSPHSNRSMSSLCLRSIPRSVAPSTNLSVASSSTSTATTAPTGSGAQESLFSRVMNRLRPATQQSPAVPPAPPAVPSASNTVAELTRTRQALNSLLPNAYKQHVLGLCGSTTSSAPTNASSSNSAESSPTSDSLKFLSFPPALTLPASTLPSSSSNDWLQQLHAELEADCLASLVPTFAHSQPQYCDPLHPGHRRQVSSYPCSPSPSYTSSDEPIASTLDADVDFYQSILNDSEVRDCPAAPSLTHNCS